MYGGKSLEADIKSDTSGAFMNCLVSLLTAMRPTGNTVDVTQAKLDAQELMSAGVKKWGTDEVKKKNKSYICHTPPLPHVRS